MCRASCGLHLQLQKRKTQTRNQTVLLRSPGPKRKRKKNTNEISLMSRLFLWNYEIENKRRLLTSDALQMFFLRKKNNITCNLTCVNLKISLSQTVLNIISVWSQHAIHIHFIPLYFYCITIIDWVVSGFIFFKEKHLRLRLICK